MRRAATIVKRTALAFYDDQMTQHAAALTYYGLMSLFPALLLAISLLGLVGEYPGTYDAIASYLHGVAPDSAIEPLDHSLRAAFAHKGTATTTLVISVLITLYGTTGVLEAARRAMNVVFDVDRGRGFVHRKAIDVASTFVLMGLGFASITMVLVGGQFSHDLLGFVGLGPAAADIWDVARWPMAAGLAMLAFSFVYYVTPDVRPRAVHAVLPGAVAGVVIWMLASWGFATYVSRVADVGALYGAFAGAIVVVGWLWLTNVALLVGAELNAAIASQRGS